MHTLAVAIGQLTSVLHTLAVAIGQHTSDAHTGCGYWATHERAAKHTGC